MSSRLSWLAVGAVLGTLASISTSFIATAQADDSSWQCYVVDRFPDTQAAADWRGAKNYTTALNTIAPNAATGTILNGDYPASNWGNQTGNAPILCVKQ